MGTRNHRLFAEKCRQMRLERGLLISHQARGLGCSPAYISHIETGKRPIPDGYVDKLANWLELDDSEKKELSRLADAQRKLVKFKPADEKRAALASDLSRVINEMPDEKVARLRELISLEKNVINDYQVVELATALRDFFKPSENLVRVLEHLVVQAAPQLTIEIEDDNYFPEGMRGESDATDPMAAKIVLSERTYLNAAERDPDATYWLMHEFAHFLLHKKHVHGGHRRSFYVREENQAHLFARTLLVSNELVDKVAENFSDLSQMARFCRVPNWVMLKRLRDARPSIAEKLAGLAVTLNGGSERYH